MAKKTFDGHTKHNPTLAPDSNKTKTPRPTPKPGPPTYD